MTRRARPALAVAPVLLVAACGGATSADVALVQITNEGFEPATLVVPAGTEVRWTNDTAAAHTVTTGHEMVADEPAIPEGATPWDSGTVRAGETFAHRFEVEGVYVYWSTAGAEQQMVGTVRVEEP